MMSTERDPRVDPRPGDVLEKDGKGYEVTRITANTVQYKVATQGACLFRDWDFFMCDARVIARGQEDRDGG